MRTLAVIKDRYEICEDGVVYDRLNSGLIPEVVLKARDLLVEDYNDTKEDTNEPQDVFKVTTPYQEKAEISGDYVLYLKSKEEVDRYLDACKKGMIFESEFELNKETVVISDTHDEEIFYEDTKVEKLGSK